MSEIEPGTVYHNPTWNRQIAILDEARGTVEVVERAEKSTELANIYTVRDNTYRHRCDSTVKLEFQLSTGELEEHSTFDRTPFVDAIDSGQSFAGTNS